MVFDMKTPGVKPGALSIYLDWFCFMRPSRSSTDQMNCAQSFNTLICLSVFHRRVR